jgi:hypothetical protein
MKQIKFKWGGVKIALLALASVVANPSQAQFGNLIPLVGCGDPLFEGINNTTMCSGSQMEYTINDNGKSVVQAGWTLSGGGFITQVNRVDFNTWFANNVSGETPSSLPTGIKVYNSPLGPGIKKIDLNINGTISTYTQSFLAGDLLVPRRITFKSLFNTGSFNVNVWARLFGCTGDKNDGRTVTVYPSPSAGDAFISIASGTADCFKGVSLSIPNAYNFPTYWSIPDEATGGSKWNQGAYVQNFTSPGNKTISVTIVSPNGCGSSTNTRVVNVPQPPDVAYSIDGIVSSNAMPSTGIIDDYLDCAKQEYGITLRANETVSTVGPNAVFNWTLPQGWEAPGLVNKNCPNGPCYSTTSRNIYVKAVTGRTEIKGGRFVLVVNTCNTTSSGRARDANNKAFSNSLVLANKPTYTLLLPDITACSNQNVLLTPTASNSAVYPLTVSWESMTGWFNNYTSIITGANNGTGAKRRVFS